MPNCPSVPPLLLFFSLKSLRFSMPHVEHSEHGRPLAKRDYEKT
jgi:hypothetical protein